MCTSGEEVWVFIVSCYLFVVLLCSSFTSDKIAWDTRALRRGE